MITFGKFHKENYSNCTLVTDTKLQGLYSITGDNVFVLPCGEDAKTFEHAQGLCRFFLNRGLSKCDTVVAIGGGSVGDVTAFAASIFKRGLKLLHVPTTVLAMIDSSIGGKTAVNLEGVKNAVGTFFVGDTLIDFDFLKTLEPCHFDHAKGEIEKYRLLCGNIAAIKQCNTRLLIEKCAEFKQSVVDLDPFDTRERRQLNMGHTVAHALELTYNLTHGQAVLLGLYYEMKIAQSLNVLDKNFVEVWAKSCNVNADKFPITEEIVSKMLNDKKNTGGRNIWFVLPCANFSYKEVSLDANQVLAILTN